jgi:hypothetical protein
MSDEIWKDVPGWALYEVSNLGNVRRKPVVMKPGKIPSGHLTVALSHGKGNPRSMYVHRLVALAFLDNPDKKRLVNHIDGNPKNNNLDNLEWATHSENNLHAYRSNGRIAPASMKVAAVNSDGEIVMSFRSSADAAKLLGVTAASVSSAYRRGGTCKGYKWVRIC